MEIYIRLISIITLAVLLVPANYAQSEYQLAEQDSLALVAFYHATDGPSWKSNQDGFGFDDLTSEWQGVYDGGYSKWLEGPAKDWFGVKVEKMPVPNSSDSAYRVTWLWPVVGRRTDGQNFLDGYVPREVGMLTSLKQFRINGNDGFRWTELPDDLYHKSLNHLDIESCWFGGEISDAFRNCTDIRKMNFRYNYIDHMPTLDFLSEEDLYNLEGTQWFYSTRLSFAIIEKTIDYFYTISPNPKEFTIEARDLFDVGDEEEVVAALGSSVTLECDDAGEKEAYITYQWYKNGLSMFGKTSRTLTISNVKESDYADYTVKITNDYVKEYDENPNYGEVFTKPTHLVAEPVAPVVEWAKTSYNGKEIILRLSKPMKTTVSGYQDFAVSTGTTTLTTIAERTSGRLKKDLVLTLSEPVNFGDQLTIAYSGDQVTDQNGGILAPFADTMVTNLARESPELVSAITTRDGRGILVWFDKYIDQNSITPSDFTINRSGNSTIVSATLQPGLIDQHISKGVLLTLENPITDSAEVISVQYTMGSLNGYLSGVVPSSSETDVTNQVSVDLTEVVLSFEDGSRLLENVVVDGSWSIVPVQMYDDGTHGDTEANDFTWTTTVSLADGNYNWDVLSRTTVNTYDTLSNVDPVTGVITLTITPVEEYIDSTLSGDVLLEFSLEGENLTGSTTFGIMNIPVTFNLTMEHSSDEVFLMGIEGDWSLGLPMEATDQNFVYSLTIPGFTVGDQVHYNYRDGNFWENQTPETRLYVVKNEGNIINDVFAGNTTSSAGRQLNDILVYPNPAEDQLYIEGIAGIQEVEIYNASGQLVGKHLPGSENIFNCNVSHFKPGLYMLLLTSDLNGRSSYLFIKN
ncbi:MAG: immunoglobulin domain-containing protein [Bacteroidales bacterium]|nr:immunoglobulin domain-containing protein [Bacteroidales bacterium]